LLAVTGATGYLGRPLLLRLGSRPGYVVRALTRSDRAAAGLGAQQVLEGDLLDPRTSLALLEPGCDVVNLAYLWKGSEAQNLLAVRNLLQACKLRRVRRLIHVSSVAVYGRAPGDRVTEESPCLPVTPYGKTKLRIERLLREECAVACAVVQPATVFDGDCPPMERMLTDLGAHRPRAWLRSGTFDARRMNLVHAQNVAAAILFLLDAPALEKVSTFIVSDDDDPANNYRAIEIHLMKAIGAPDYALPRLRVPAWALSMLLRARGHDNVNPRRVFDGTRLRGLGWAGPIAFSDGLRGFAARFMARQAGPGARA
jgi:nucleoside-diphosphate-sugar epimerase